ncbi:recombinase family protein [Vibrio parahaemolyticus]|uniref:recombinase family protein n=1 Tax=Vibrio parahaemolyticus TaxID=670 RepID=UPI00226B2E90|nr:recombinase family protein [Vibrio parahaemolyticus]MCX8845294.1 recombinase family protein [Vibrio parahaemolyticus]
MAVYGYCRVSTVRQAEEGESLEVQEQKITNYCLLEELDPPVFLVDRGESAGVQLAKRTKGASLLAKLKPGDHVVASKLDRLFRRASDALNVAEWMKENGVSLHLLDMKGDVMNDSMSRAFFTMASAFAELERNRIKERISEVKAMQKAAGRYLGGRVPVGYRVEAGKLVADETGQAVISYITNSGAEIGSQTLAKMIKEKYGVTISHNTVYRIRKGAENA